MYVILLVGSIVGASERAAAGIIVVAVGLSVIELYAVCVVVKIAINVNVILLVHILQIIAF